MFPVSLEIEVAGPSNVFRINVMAEAPGSSSVGVEVECLEGSSNPIMNRRCEQYGCQVVDLCGKNVSPVSLFRTLDYVVNVVGQPVPQAWTEGDTLLWCLSFYNLLKRTFVDGQ